MSRTRLRAVSSRSRKSRRPAAFFQFTIDADHRPEFVAQQRREAGAGAIAKFVKPDAQRVTPREDLGAREFAEAIARTAPSPMTVVAANQPQQRRFECVVIAIAHRFEPRRLGNRTAEFFQRAAQPILGIARGSQSAERFDLVDQGIDLAVALERLVMPGRVEVAPFEQFLRGGPQQRPRAVAVGHVGAAQDASHAFAGICQRLLEPAIEGGIEDRAGGVFGSDLEHRIDCGLDRTLAQQVGAKRMNRADARLFELAQRVVQPLARSGIGIVMARALDFSAQPQLQFARRLLGEGHGHDAIELAAAAARRRRRCG